MCAERVVRMGFGAAVACVLLASPAAAAVFTNSTPIAIPGTATIGNASPSPSNITVSGIGPGASGLTVTLFGLSHSFPDDIDALLIAPNGNNVLLMSDAGDSFDLFGINLNFSDSASAFLPDETQITTGTYLPTNYGTTADTFPSPAPGGPFGTSLEALLAGNANGTWSLYIVDDAINDTGSLSGGWQISIANVGSTVVPEPATLASAGLAGLIGLGARWRRRRRAAT